MQRITRIENALWGLFAGDALAMPAHWFYNLNNLREAFDGGLTGFEPAPHPHPESFMVGMSYEPDIDTAMACGRPFDILHQHTRFYRTSYTQLGIQTGERESEHGNATPSLDERFHYHHGLQAGQNTLGAHLVRVLMRSVIEQGHYDEAHFLDAFVHFLTTPNTHDDPYREVYLRRWFENHSRGLPLHACAERQRRSWSIGSMGGMLRPLTLSLLAPTAHQALGFAIEHQNLTHRSENVAAALGLTAPLLQDLLNGSDPMQAARTHTRPLRTPKLNGHQMFALYREHRGPGNIPNRQMWDLHTDLSNRPFDLDAVAALPPEEVVLTRYATACYTEHGLPMLLYFAAHHGFDPTTALLANANAGGDNVHRNGVLGLLLGAANLEFPPALKQGLADFEALQSEIQAFAKLAAPPW